VHIAGDIGVTRLRDSLVPSSRGRGGDTVRLVLFVCFSGGGLI
jgi:hypothetical protein